MDDGVLYQRVAGVSFYQSALEACRPGQPVRFIHEPDNPHDAMAVKVVTDDGQTLGYIPRTSPLRVAIHERGIGISGAVFSVGYGRACLLGVTLSIAMSDDLPAVASYYPDQPAPEPPSGGFRYWVSDSAGVERILRLRRGSGSPTRAQRPRYPQRSVTAG